MPIPGLVRRLPEIGRLRAGQLVTMADGRRRPSALAAWRFTSSSQASLDAVAVAFSGRIEPWTSPAGPAFQVISEVDRLAVVLPPAGAFSQAMELYTAGGLARRCDGQVSALDGSACQCPADPGERRELAKAGQACQPVTRLSVMLPELPGFGSWLYQSRGWSAAAELGGMAEILEALSASGRMTPAVLRLEQRERRVPGQPTRQFTVAVLEAPQLRLADLLSTGTSAGQIGPPAAAQRRLGPPMRGANIATAGPATLALPATTRAVEALPMIVCSDVAGGFLAGETCVLDAGHPGAHRSAAESSWPALPVAAQA